VRGGGGWGTFEAYISYPLMALSAVAECLYTPRPVRDTRFAFRRPDILRPASPECFQFSSLSRHRPHFGCVLLHCYGDSSEDLAYECTVVSTCSKTASRAGFSDLSRCRDLGDLSSECLVGPLGFEPRTNGL
jgi:hypothetical protein